MGNFEEALVVIWFLCLFACSLVTLIAWIAEGRETARALATNLVVPLGFGIPLVIKHIYDSHINKSWSKPFTNDGKIYRYNSKLMKYQQYEDSSFKDNKWKDLKNIIRATPVNIVAMDYSKSSDRTFNFNPYEWFSKPTKPTSEEIALFEIEFNYEFKKISKEVKKICK